MAQNNPGLTPTITADADGGHGGGDGEDEGIVNEDDAYRDGRPDGGGKLVNAADDDDGNGRRDGSATPKTKLLIRLKIATCVAHTGRGTTLRPRAAWDCVG